MGKIAIVGCQQSGKTVFMAALTDYFQAGQRDGQSCWLTPENREAHEFTEQRHREMRVNREWPDATWNEPTSLKWSLHLKNGDVKDVEMLEFSGEVFRAAFKDEGSEAEKSEAVRTLMAYLGDAEFVVVLVALRELFRKDEEGERYQADDIESTWVTRGLVKFAKTELRQTASLLLALTQADLYRRELDAFGGPAGVLKKKLPTIYGLDPNLPVVAVASVSRTTDGGRRPAKDYTTDGVLPVMKAYAERIYGDPSGVIGELDGIVAEIVSMEKAPPSDLLEQKVRRHGALIEKLRNQVMIVDALYTDVIARHVKFNDDANALLARLKDLLSQNVEEQQDSPDWDDLNVRYPDFAKTVSAYQRESRRQYRQMEFEAAKAERLKRERREAEAVQREEEARRDEERRRKLELEEQERRIAAEAEQKRLDLENQKQRVAEERARTARRTLAVRAVVVFVLLCGAALATMVFFDRRAKAERAERERIETENAAKLAEVRKAEAEKCRQEAENRAAELRRQQLAEENRRKELELKKQETERKVQAEKQRRIDEENERKRLELEQKKVAEERALEAEKRKRLEEENRKRQIEVEREAELRRAEEAKKRELAAAEERKRLAAEKAAAEKKAAEAAARKLAEDKASAAQTVLRLVEAINDGSVARSVELLAEAREQEKLLVAGDKVLLDDASSCVETMKMAEAGDESAQMRVAEMFYGGNGVVGKNHAEAYKWYQKVADAGDPTAQYKVGEMLVMGDGVAEDVSTAFQYFLKSANQGNSDAQFFVAEMYRLGKGVVEDQKRANDWYEKAAECGNANAQLAWSKRLKNGDGRFFSDEDEAFNWLWKAAQSGSAEACYLIGCQYYSGKGRLEYSIRKAYKYFLKAKKGGYSSKDLDRKLESCRWNGAK